MSKINNVVCEVRREHGVSIFGSLVSFFPGFFGEMTDDFGLSLMLSSSYVVIDATTTVVILLLSHQARSLKRELISFIHSFSIFPTHKL